MTKYLILGEPFSASIPNYRGTHRETIHYSSQFDESHPLNQIFFAYLEQQDNFGQLDDLELAKEIVTLNHKYLATKFEVIQVDRNKLSQSADTSFLGYDLSSGLNLSYLEQGLNYCTEDRVQLISLLCLLESYFKPRLNKHGLFNEFETAKFLLNCIKDINVLKPNFWDDPDTYEIIGLSEIERN